MSAVRTNNQNLQHPQSSRMKTQLATLALLAFASAAPTHAQVGDAQKHDTRIESLLDNAGLKYEIDSDGDFKLLFGLDDDRTHIVWINSNTERYGHLEIREIWAVGLHSSEQLHADLHRSLLERNNQYKLGSWKLQRISRGEGAIFYVQVAANLDRESLMSSIKIVAESADELEEELTGKDDL